jgi:hypothetical protein
MWSLTAHINQHMRAARQGRDVKGLVPAINECVRQAVV